MTKLRDDLRTNYGVDTTYGSEDATISGDIIHTGDLDRTGATSVTGGVTVTGDPVITGDVTLTGIPAITGDPVIIGDTTLTGALGVTGEITVAGDTTIVGSVSTTGARLEGITVVNAATYTVLATDNLLHVTYAGAVTITVPTALSVLGRLLEIKDARGASTYNITVATEGAETIEGSATLLFDVDYNCLTMYSDGTNWWLRSLYTKRLQAYVATYLPTATATTITTANTFVPILGTFTNTVMKGFELDTDKIKYLYDTTRYFEIDWSATVASEDAHRTAHIGVAKTGATLSVTGASVMGTYFNTADEEISISGTTVFSLAKDDTIQLQITSDADADVITVSHFESTIRPFSG